MRSAWHRRTLQQCVCLVEGWGVAYRGEQVSSLAQRAVSSGCAEGDQAASLAEERGGELRDVAKTPLTSASATPATAAAAAAHVGATLTLNGTDLGERLQITLVKIVDPSHAVSQYLVPAAGMREIAIEFRYKNVGSTTYMQSILTDITVLDAAAHSYSIDIITGDTAAGPGFPSGLVNIGAGESADGFVSFQVPTGTPITEVKVGLDYGFGGDTGEWLVP